MVIRTNLRVMGIGTGFPQLRSGYQVVYDVLKYRTCGTENCSGGFSSVVTKINSSYACQSHSVSSCD